MKNWKTCDADVVKITKRHFTSGRVGKKIEFIGIHYMAGNLTTEQCYDVWQSREASAHYCVEDDGRVGQVVWDADTAWALGDFDANCRSINIEHANKTGGTVSEKCLNAGAHLTAALCLLYGLGRPTWGKNMYPHRHFASTSCPGELYGSQKAEYQRRARKWYDEMSGGSSGAEAGTGEIFQVEEDGIFGPDTAAIAQAVEGIIVSGKVYNQPASNRECFVGNQCWCFRFTDSPKAGGSLLVRRIQNQCGIPWDECDGFFGSDTGRRFIKRWVKKPKDTYRLGYPSTAVKNYQKWLNEQARKLKIKRVGY